MSDPSVRVDLTAVEAEHVEGEEWGGVLACVCGDDWPCVTLAMAEALRIAREALEEAQRWTDSGGEAGQLLHHAAVEVDALVDFDGGES